MNSLVKLDETDYILLDINPGKCAGCADEAGAISLPGEAPKIRGTLKLSR